MAGAFPRIHALGEAALLLEVGDQIDPQLLRRVMALGDAVRVARPIGLQDVVPCYASVLVCFEAAAEAQAARAHLEQLLREPLPPAPLGERHFRIPCCYEGACAPDLPAVAAGDVERAVALHTGQDFLVYGIGFLPGFTYLGELPEGLAAPRLGVPRTKVPAGSVGIAGRQTGIYPVESPGGWQLIGRTPLRLFAPDQVPPAALRLGDTVRFYPITETEYGRLAAQRPWPLPS
jgi:KipI family sensor histidine kinase inhibitor